MKWDCLILEPEGFSSSAQKQLSLRFNLTLGYANASKNLDAVAVIFCRLGQMLDKKFLAQFRNLEIVCSPTTGTNHIDQEFCSLHDIRLITLKGQRSFLEENITSTSEFTWGLLLSAWRYINIASNRVKAGEWDREKYFGKQLKGKCLGLLGMGRVGKQVADIGTAFGMNIAFYDPYVAGCNGKAETIENLVSIADILVICCELNSDTEGLVGEEVLKRCKEDTLIVNTARGEIVQEEALLNSLKENKIFYAADTICGEFSRESRNASKLLNFSKKSDRVLITPHLGGASLDAVNLTEEFVTAKLLEVF